MKYYSDNSEYNTIKDKSLLEIYGNNNFTN